MELNQADKVINETVCRRHNMVQARLNYHTPIKDILEEYGVSRPVFYKFLNRFKKYGIFGLRDQSSSPKHNANKTSENDENELIRLHNKYPYFSSYELSEICGLGYKAIQRIRKRNNLKKEYLPKSKKKAILMKIRSQHQEGKREESKEIKLQKKKNKK